MQDKRTKCAICGKPLGRNKLCCSQKCYSKFKTHYKTCVMCGNIFQCPPANNKNTCSKECSSLLRKKQYKDGIYDNALKIFEAKRDEYAAEHTGELHPKAKYWVIKSPDGKIYEMKNLKDFIRQHPDLFDGTVKQAYDGFVKIKQTALGKCKRKSYQWKGWTLVDWGE